VVSWPRMLPPPCEPEPAFPPAAELRPAEEGGQRRSSATAPGTTVTPGWLLTQLIPSPELAIGDEGGLFGLRWQLTPLLYSFGLDRRLSRFRAFVVEPLVRTSGSIELFFSPEYLALDTAFSRRFGFRGGVRAYFPVLEKGDYLSVSLGTAYARYDGRNAVSYQLGAYVLFGFLGFEQSFLPALDQARWISTLNLRFF